MRKILSYFFVLSMPFLQWLNAMVNRTLTSTQRSKRLTMPMPITMLKNTSISMPTMRRRILVTVE